MRAVASARRSRLTTSSLKSCNVLRSSAARCSSSSRSRRMRFSSSAWERRRCDWSWTWTTDDGRRTTGDARVTDNARIRARDTAADTDLCGRWFLVRRPSSVVRRPSSATSNVPQMSIDGQRASDDADERTKQYAEHGELALEEHRLELQVSLEQA